MRLLAHFVPVSSLIVPVSSPIVTVVIRLCGTPRQQDLLGVIPLRRSAVLRLRGLLDT